MNDNYEEKYNFLNKPLSMRGWPTWLVILAGVIGVGYILNPGMGIFELIPDSIPVIGNLDEGAAATAIWYGLLEWFEMRRRRKDNRQS